MITNTGRFSWRGYSVDVEEHKHRMKILAPVAGRLPPRPLLVGQWPEATTNLVG